MQATNHPFQIGAQMFSRTVARFAAFAQHEKPGFALEFDKGVDQVAMPQAACRRRQTGVKRTLPGSFQQQAATLERDGGALLINRGQVVEQMFVRTKADVAPQVNLLRSLRVVIEHIDEFESGAEAGCGPGRVIAHGAGVSRVSQARENFVVHGRFP